MHKIWMYLQRGSSRSLMSRKRWAVVQSHGPLNLIPSQGYKQTRKIAFHCGFWSGCMHSQFHLHYMQKRNMTQLWLAFTSFIFSTHNHARDTTASLNKTQLYFNASENSSNIVPNSAWLSANWTEDLKFNILPWKAQSLPYSRIFMKCKNKSLFPALLWRYPTALYGMLFIFLL